MALATFSLLLTGCANYFPGAVYVPPILAAPVQARTGGIQGVLGIHPPSLVNSGKQVVAYSAQGQGYYTATSHLFLEGKLGGAYSATKQFSAANTQIAPGIGLYYKRARTTFLASIGFDFQGTTYKNDLNKYNQKETAVNFYQKIGARIRLGQSERLQLMAGVLAYENLNTRFRSNNDYGAGLGNVRTYTTRIKGAIVQPFVGLSLGQADKLSGFAQIGLGVYSFQRYNQYDGYDLLNLNVGLTVPIGF